MTKNPPLPIYSSFSDRHFLGSKQIWSRYSYKQDVRLSLVRCNSKETVVASTVICIVLCGSKLNIVTTNRNKGDYFVRSPFVMVPPLKGFLVCVCVWRCIYFDVTVQVLERESIEHLLFFPSRVNWTVQCCWPHFRCVIVFVWSGSSGEETVGACSSSQVEEKGTLSCGDTRLCLHFICRAFTSRVFIHMYIIIQGREKGNTVKVVYILRVKWMLFLAVRIWIGQKSVSCV